MLMPKKIKFRKVQKGTLKGLSKGARTIWFGEYGLEAIEPCRLSAQQIEAMRVTLSRHLRKKKGESFLRVFPDKPVTKKPAEVRMGKGKGAVEEWVASVKQGRILFEIGGAEDAVAIRALELAARKLPLRTKIIRASEEV